MSKTAVEVRASSIRIVELEVPIKEVAGYFRSIPAGERAFTLTKAIEVGVFCLERGRTAQDTDFVKRKITELLAEVEHAVTAIPTKAEEALVKKMGTTDGQVLSPVKRLIDDATRESTRRIGELKTLLADDLDPKNAKSTLGGALRSLRELLNPKNTESVQSVLCQAVASATTEGGTLAKAVKAEVEDALKPLLSEIDGLAKEVRGRDAAAEALEQTTLKGEPFEEGVVGTLRRWAEVVGAEVSHVGADNQPGDVVVTLRGDGIVDQPISIVIEARDRNSRAMGRKAISAEMARKMAERSANTGIFVSRTREGLSLREIGEWAEGACGYGPWVACIFDHLITALRFLIVQRRLADLREEAPEVDTASVEQQVRAIRTSLGRIKTVKTKLTEIDACSDSIGAEADSLRDEVRTALSSIEDALRVGCSKKPVAVSVGPLSVIAASAD